MGPIAHARAAAVTCLVFAASSLAFESQLNKCPESCAAQPGSARWTVYNSLNDLKWCDEPMLLSMNVFMPLDDPKSTIKISACSADPDPSNRRRQDQPETSCPVAEESEAIINVLTSGGKGFSSQDDILAAASQVQSFFADPANCEATIAFAYSNGAVVGAYVGKKMQNSGAASTILQSLLDNLHESSSKQQFVQVCGDGRNADYTMGVVADASGSGLASVQKIIKGWVEAECVTDFDESSSSNSTVFQVPFVPITSNLSPRSRINPRADCTAIQVVPGDSCWSLSQTCGIFLDDFYDYNGGDGVCATLQPKQWVCCSSGTLPDFSPDPNPDGSCFSYTVQPGDTCDAIIGEHSLTEEKLLQYNENTWGWNGCDLLFAQAVICLSSGTPPMPAPISNAKCGPQKPDTEPPADFNDLADLNPCPLNSCCNIWGQCGITPEFCTAEPGPVGAPGTAPAGSNGCISNCGVEIVTGSGPANYIKLGYFEAFNLNRPCLNMDVLTIPELEDGSFTHVHFAFAGINPDFTINLDGVKDQFYKFASMTGVKRIVSFGGWSFSTSKDSFPIFRAGVSDENRETFALNVVQLLIDYDLDGLDFDWEYPGAEDIPGVPAGDPEDPDRYLAFLQRVHAFLPNEKTVSIAAPASYWYLKPFPIKEIAEVCDYIVYMTYDLHGQWDYGSKWANPGCENGNCLRSHVNSTETEYALAMITKAGVPAEKIVVGVSSYGRSFGMTDPGCTGIYCTFNGPFSSASPGECTGEAGYVANWELDQIAKKRTVQTYYDDDSKSDIMVYDGNWVAYMSNAEKTRRINLYRSWGFAGTTDWAVDLSEDHSDSINKTNVQACEDWEDLKCDIPAVSEPFNDPGERWLAAGANCAWNDWLRVWNENATVRTFSFSNAASAKMFKGNPNFDCEDLGSSNCATITCDDAHSRPPASHFILSSMANVFDIHKKMKAALLEAQVQADTVLGTFTTTFAPIENTDDDALRIILGILGMAWALVSSPMWNNYLTGTRYFSAHPNGLQTLKDITNGMVNGALNLANDGTAGATLSVQNDLGSTLGTLCEAWSKFVVKSNEYLLSGDDDKGIETLGMLINDGTMLEPGTHLPDTDEMLGYFKQVIFATLIPRAWNLSDHSPVLIASGHGCGEPFGSYYMPIQADKVDKLKFCVDDEAYYLGSATGNQYTCGPHSPNDPDIDPCPSNNFTMPPGADELTGDEGAWGGVTLEELVKSAVATKKKWGNSWDPHDVDEEYLKTITDLTVTSEMSGDAKPPVEAPGVAPIPVCSLTEAVTNWRNHEGKGPNDKWDGYPCNPKT